MVDIIDEIKEDLHHERLAKLWKQFGAWIIGAALLIVAGTAGNVWWQGHKAKQQEELSNTYFSAIELLQKDKTEDAVKLLEELRNTDSKAYPALAGFTQASNLIQEKKYREAAAVYESIADNDKVDETLQDLALLQLVNLEIKYKLAADSVIELRLADLTQPQNAWHFSASELQASYALGQGNEAKALEIFKSLEEDPLAPENIRNRAAEMVEALHEYDTEEKPTEKAE